MRKLLLVMAFILIGTIAYAGEQHVRGYWRDTNHDGVKDTYVQPYVRTSPNSTRNDNYSTRGNYNPYTGERGTQPRDEDYDAIDRSKNSSYYGNRN